MRRVRPSIFEDDVIKILVNVDGFPIFNNSKQSYWPILAQIYHGKLYCKPFVVALWHGVSKPASIESYLEDFVNEVNDLTKNGVQVENKLYGFELKAIVADTPARAFLKCTKSHTAFYACERCETRGESIEVEKKRKTKG